MSDPYQRAKAGRLTFKDGTLATLKSIDKKKHKKKKKNNNTSHQNPPDETQPFDDSLTTSGGEAPAVAVEESSASVAGEGGEDIYTIDAAKRMKYDQLFPVEAKKFGYNPKSVTKSVEDALDDRVKKKADRYCK